MHDMFSPCIEATRKLVQKLKEEGYVFVTVETLILVRNGEIISNKEYRFVR